MTYVLNIIMFLPLGFLIPLIWKRYRNPLKIFMIGFGFSLSIELCQLFNRRNTDKSPLAHAEIAAIRKASKKLDDWRLEECTLYVTLEPCQMCAGAIIQSRIPRVVVGCMNPKAGCAGSVLDLLHIAQFNHQAELETGVLEEECSQLMKQFFRELRQRKKEEKEEKKRAESME